MKITFSLTDSIGTDGLFATPPTPAKLFTPEWYKNMPPTIDGQKKFGISVNHSFGTNSTAKGCSPLLDALTSGYIYSAPLDIEVRKVGETEYSFKWRSPDEFLSLHSAEQHPGLPAPAEMEDNQVLKWGFPFTVITPPGYSCLFTHPLNRHDLPFRTFSGVVDTDSYELPVQFPFQMITKPTDILIIEKGTPVCQIIPFKRENWTSEVVAEPAEITAKNRFLHRSTIVKSYKKRNWVKKSYE